MVNNELLDNGEKFIYHACEVGITYVKVGKDFVILEFQEIGQEAFQVFVQDWDEVVGFIRDFVINLSFYVINGWYTLRGGCGWHLF